MTISILLQGVQLILLQWNSSLHKKEPNRDQDLMFKSVFFRDREFEN